MLETIGDLVRNVTIVVLIAGFLEMLLPSSEIKRFVKAVMGLFILVSMLNPLLSLFDRNISCAVLAWQDPVPATDINTILHQGEAISRQMNEKSLVLYTKNLAKQIETIVKLVKGVAWVEAEVEMDKSYKNPDFNQIKRVVLVVGTGEKSIPEDTIREVTPIEIKISGEKRFPVENPDHQEMKGQITETLKSFFNLREEQIHIVIVSQNEEGANLESRE